LNVDIYGNVVIYNVELI